MTQAPAVPDKGIMGCYYIPGFMTNPDSVYKKQMDYCSEWGLPKQCDYPRDVNTTDLCQGGGLQKHGGGGRVACALPVAQCATGICVDRSHLPWKRTHPSPLPPMCR